MTRADGSNLDFSAAINNIQNFDLNENRMIYDDGNEDFDQITLSRKQSMQSEQSKTMTEVPKRMRGNSMGFFLTKDFVDDAGTEASLNNVDTMLGECEALSAKTNID